MRKFILTLLVVSLPVMAGDLNRYSRDWFVSENEVTSYGMAAYIAGTPAKVGETFFGLSCRDLTDRGYDVYFEIQTLIEHAPDDTKGHLPFIVKGSGGFSRAYSFFAYGDDGGNLRLMITDPDDALFRLIMDGTWVGFEFKGKTTTYSLLGSNKAIHWLFEQCPLKVNGPFDGPAKKWSPSRFDGGA